MARSMLSKDKFCSMLMICTRSYIRNTMSTLLLEFMKESVSFMDRRVRMTTGMDLAAEITSAEMALEVMLC